MAAGRRGVMGRGRRGAGRETGVTATARRGVGGGFLLAARLVMLVTMGPGGHHRRGDPAEGPGGQPGQLDRVEGVHDLGKTLVGPFKDLFKIDNAKVAIAVNWGLAALLYLIVGSLIARILRRARRDQPPRPGGLTAASGRRDSNPY